MYSTYATARVSRISDPKVSRCSFSFIWMVPVCRRIPDLRKKDANSLRDFGTVSWFAMRMEWGLG